MDKSELRQLFSKSGNPMLQAFYTLGIEAPPQHLLKEYFLRCQGTYNSRWISSIMLLLEQLMSLASSFLILIYRLGTLIFLSKGDLTTRKYYLNDFPTEFRKIVSNEDIGKIVLNGCISGGKRKDV